MTDSVPVVDEDVMETPATEDEDEPGEDEIDIDEALPVADSDPAPSQ